MIQPYYKEKPEVKLIFVVRVSGNKYCFDTLERATEFMQYVLSYSVSDPFVTLIISTREGLL